VVWGLEIGPTPLKWLSTVENSIDKARDMKTKSKKLRLATFLRLLPLGPSMALLGLFMAGPIIWSVYISFTNTALTGPNAKDPQIIGFDNYVNLWNDSDFPQAIWLTVVFVVMSAVVGQNTLGLGLALLMQKSSAWARKITGTAVMAAWMLPEIVVAFASYVYYNSDGTLNQILGVAGIPPIDWLYDYPMVAVILANTWRGAAFSMMVYQAALDDVPPEITEAAKIDGAGGWQNLFLVTIPMIRSSITTNLMLITLQTLSVFTLIYTMTRGGPSKDSTTLPILAYDVAFRVSDIGYGTAISVVMILIGAIFSFIYIRALRTEKEPK
jgi:multiple sugar transport system permease protein